MPRRRGSYSALVYRFEAELWLYDGDAGWCFVTVPDDVSDDIEVRTAEHRAGFGAVRVRVTVGTTTWETSVFPDRKRAAYLLPVKKQVRGREGVEVGDRVAVELEVVGQVSSHAGGGASPSR